MKQCVFALFLTLPAHAEPWACEMSVACQNIDCSPIEDRYEVIAADHEGQLFLTSPAGDHPVTRLSRRGEVPAVYAGAGPAALGQLLTIIEDGRAVLTLHGYDGPARTTTIYGTCTES